MTKRKVQHISRRPTSTERRNAGLFNALLGAEPVLSVHPDALRLRALADLIDEAGGPLAAGAGLRDCGIEETAILCMLARQRERINAALDKMLMGAVKGGAL